MVICNAYQARNNYEWRTSTTWMQIRAQSGPIQGPLGRRATCGMKGGVSKRVAEAGGSLRIPAHGGWRQGHKCESAMPSRRQTRPLNERALPSIARGFRPRLGSRDSEASVHPASGGGSQMCRQFSLSLTKILLLLLYKTFI